MDNRRVIVHEALAVGQVEAPHVHSALSTRHRRRDGVVAEPTFPPSAKECDEKVKLRDACTCILNVAGVEALLPANLVVVERRRLLADEHFR